MDFKGKIRAFIVKLLDNILEQRKLILALSCVVVFVTTYVLILPAFTLEKTEAAKQGGIDVPGIEQAADEDPDAEDEAVDAEKSGETDAAPANKAKEAKTEKAAKEPKQTKQNNGSTEVTLQNVDSEDYTVAVEGTDDVLSGDMSVNVREIDKSTKKLKKEYDSLYSDALEAVQKEEGSEKPSTFAFAKFYDISLMDGKTEVEPGSAVDVKISFNEELQKELKVKDPDRVRIVHFAVDKDTGEVTSEVLDSETTKVTVENSKVTEATFTTESFSVFAVVYTVDMTYDAETGTLFYEDNKIQVTVSAKEKDTLPEEAVLNVKEIIPKDEAAADVYAEALTALSNTLRKQGAGFSAAKVYDFTILDKAGKEIEPNGDVEVKIDYKEKPEFVGSDGSTSDIQIAHIVEDSSKEDGLSVEIMDADIDSTDSGTVSGAEFTTDSFSAYVVFNKNGISETEPTDLGSYGWIRFHTDGEQDTTSNQTANPDSTTIQWGYYKNDGSNLPALNTAWAYRRIVKVRLWLPKNGQDSSVYDGDHYNETATAQYFWVWQNEINVEEFELPGYEVVHTRMHTAWDEENGREPVENDSLVGSYAVRGYRRSTISDEPGVKNSDLNVLDVYAKRLPQTTGMNYIIRYVHADGSVTDGNVRSLSSGSVSYNADQYKRAGEVYAGTSIVTGSEAINANTANGTGTITYKSDVPLAKVYVYYKVDPSGNGNPNTKGRYDKDEKGYYTGAKGLYTDKSAQAVSGNDRQFILNLESWYVDNAASVGMVLDASGSMAWTSGAPEPIVLTDAQVAAVRRANGMQQDAWGRWTGDTDIYFNGGSNDSEGNPPNEG